MASKKNIKAVRTSDLKSAVATHAARTTATVTDLVIARITLQRNVDKLLRMSADIDECLNKFDLPMVEAEIGANTLLQVDGITNIVFRESVKTITQVNLKEIEDKIGKSFIPAQYRKSISFDASVLATLDASLIAKGKISYDTKKMGEDSMDGTLASVLVPYVSAHKETVLDISQRATRGTSGPAKGE